MGAIGDPYASTAELAHRLEVDDVQLSFAGLVDAASRDVESFCHRQFNKTTIATARRFRPLDWRRLPVDDFHTITDLEVDVAGTVWDLASIDPQPWNGVKNGVPGWPFENLYTTNGNWPNTSTITVTAQWGWAAVPEGIKQATLDVAAAKFRAGGSAYPVRSQAIDGYSVTYKLPGEGEQVLPELEAAVPYRRKRFGIA
jgi:hypothetical protein